MAGRSAGVAPADAREFAGLSLRRFLSLRQRCFEMRDIATGVRGAWRGRDDSADSIRTPALDKLLFLFLKLLMSQAGLERFCKSTSEPEAGVTGSRTFANASPTAQEREGRAR